MIYFLPNIYKWILTLLHGGGGERGTLNAEVIGMLVGIFLENPKKYPDFDFKPLKNTQISILGAVLGKWLPFSKTFPENPKKYQNQNFIP